MSSRLDPGQISAVLQSALQGGWIRPEDTAAILLHTDYLHQRLQALSQAFPSHALHTVAVKAMPLPSVLRGIAQAGFGAEVASLPELKLALRCGFPADRIVFDSPAKTKAELAWAVAEGVTINADNLEELARIHQILGDSMPRAGIGLRINPQVGTGSIAATSTAGEWSKFGMPLNESRADILMAFKSYSWLSGLHMHIGSQGISLDQLSTGAARLQALLSEVRQAVAQLGRPNQLRTVNIGGGLPAQYADEDLDIRPEEYVARLRQVLPALQDPTLQIVTEFGRWTFAGAGWVASQVEYVKHWGQRPTAILHVGADLLLRDCYQPGIWKRGCLAFSPNGILKQGSLQNWTLAGPLCFSGDIPQSSTPLPALEPKDWVVLRDVGAYSFSMWSRYNSRQMPRILGWDGHQFSVLKERESAEEVIGFWE
jgi:diaminopimelate decarboxylase